MNGLRPLAPKQVIKSFQAWRGGTRNPLQVMNLCDAGKFLLNRIVRGAVRHACAGKWNRDVNVIGGKSLSLAGLAWRKFRAHSNVSSSAARTARGYNEFASDGANLSGSRRRGFFAAGRANQREAQQKRKYARRGFYFCGERFK
jgi:hypothetical protein